MTPDINVLVAASRTDHPHHQIARKWLEEALARATPSEGLQVLPMVAAGFLRIVTNARVFPDPTPIADAMAFLDAVIGQDGAAVSSGRAEWDVLRRLCLERRLVGNAIPDAWIAAAVKVRNKTLVTFDRDFARLLGEDEVLFLRP